MLARLVSLRLWLLAAMLTSAAVGLAATVFLFNAVQDAHERKADLAKARQEAAVIAAAVHAGAGVQRIAAFQTTLLSDRVTVVRDGRVVFRGPIPKGRDLELIQQVRFPGGLVRIDDYTSPSGNTTLDLTLITAGLVGLVIIAAVVTSTALTRAVRAPVQRAIVAAERVSHGEFSARMGSSGPDELVKLGRAFDDMAARLERTDRDQRQFLADVAHEIATPVNTVSGFALALADGAAEDPAQRDEARSLIKAETSRLRDLLSDLRQLTGLDLAEGVHPAPLSLAAFVEHVAARFRPIAAASQVSLSASVHDATVVTDRRLLEMVASNLVSNAIRYTPAGGRVALRARIHRESLIVSVRDTGVGIAAEHQGRIFDRLYRVDATRDRATGGSGLGLAIASRAAASLGGHLEVSSTVGRGSEFRLIAPAHAQD